MVESSSGAGAPALPHAESTTDSSAGSTMVALPTIFLGGTLLSVVVVPVDVDCCFWCCC